MDTNERIAMPSTKSLIGLMVVGLLAVAGVSSWIYQAGISSMRAQAKEHGLLMYTEGAEAGASDHVPVAPRSRQESENNLSKLLQHVEQWAMKITVATTASGAGLMLSLVFGIGWWRQSWTRRVTQRRREDEANSQKVELALGELQQELKLELEKRTHAEAQLQQLTRELEERVKVRTAELSRAHAALEKELNDRKQAEKSLTYQRQELTRSKDVLEMHVQARTQELQTLQRRYEHILNSAGEGIYGLDLQGRTTFVNPAAARVTGWTVEELVGKPEREVFHRQATDGAPTGHTQMMDRHGNLLAEQTFYRKDGGSFPVEYVRTPMMENGRMVGAVVLFKDITERKRAEESLARKAAELARSNAELEQFAYVASHDLQEPLRKIQAFGDRLKSRIEAAQLTDGRDFLERMQSAAARMRTLIDDLLTFSRVISSNQPFVPVDLAQITKDVLTDLEVRIEKSKARIEVGALPTIAADPLQMRQLLQNLISNSLKFQAEGTQPVVKIDAQIEKRPFSCAKDPTPDDEVCVLKVEDNGIGFEEQYAEKIFAVFQRLHGRSEYEGTGVGLAVCRRITDRHGGTITAAAKVGQGATFTVTLPMRQPNGESHA